MGAAVAIATITKRQGWDVALVEFCDFMRKLPVEYGFADCVLFAAGAVEVQTGADFAAPHRGKYADEAGARAYMASLGWADVDDVVDAHLPRVDVRMRRRGDILLFEGPFGKSLGVCLGRWACVLATEGAGLIKSTPALAAWRVG